MAFKVEPETFGLGFLLIFKFDFIDLIAAWGFFNDFFFFSITHSGLVDPDSLADFVDGLRTTKFRISEEPINSKSPKKHK